MPGRTYNSPSSRRQTVENLVHAKGAKPILSLEDLRDYSVELFDSDEEVEEFLAFVRGVRRAGFD